MQAVVRCSMRAFWAAKPSLLHQQLNSTALKSVASYASKGSDCPPPKPTRKCPEDECTDSIRNSKEYSKYGEKKCPPGQDKKATGERSKKDYDSYGNRGEPNQAPKTPAKCPPPCPPKPKPCPPPPCPPPPPKCPPKC